MNKEEAEKKLLEILRELAVLQSARFLWRCIKADQIRKLNTQAFVLEAIIENFAALIRKHEVQGS